jgi:tRNA(Ile2) C34 agmatinyltransferase TiaS
MNAVEYSVKFRRLATISMIVVGVAAAVLVAGKVIPFSEYVPFIAIGVGLIPVILFHLYNKPICEKCSGEMKIKSGFPNLVYRCRECGDVVDTGMHADY